MIYPPVWLWLVAFALVFVGLRFSRSVERLPPWLCGLVVLAALIGMWYLLNGQFGNYGIQIHLP
ncbi:MAG TPA: hypothetical protein VGM01_15365 [Ktedonobacteraceae bacterium]|jgi:4-amino-4-deoxy-L-arabinose transferase-like glycosyltransferase